ACLIALLAPLLLGACVNMPAALDPHGSNAQQTARIAWVLFWGGGLIFAFVIALAAFALFAAPAHRAWLGRQNFVVGAGIVFPIVTLSALLFYAFKVSGELAGTQDAVPLKIEIVGQMWWWRVRYVDAGGTSVLVTANEVHIPVGRTVEFSLESADVLHSFWVPNLAGKLDLIPGRVNVLRLTAGKPGVFRGQCAEYCGAQHAKMAFHVVAHAVPEFDAWLVAQQLPAAAPRTPALERGMALFVARCGVCHTARGTPAAGQLGPDLTHVGSRLALAAGTLPNNAGTIAGWIAASQHIKPENRMPSFDRFTGEELRALAAYVESLQ
ncbi:MAG: cytochrome c oxidase subunit II, partial [Burkholderiales bacterium]